MSKKINVRIVAQVELIREFDADAITLDAEGLRKVLQQRMEIALRQRLNAMGVVLDYGEARRTHVQVNKLTVREVENHE